MNLNIASIIDLNNPLSSNFNKETITNLSSRVDNYFLINIGTLINGKKESQMDTFLNCRVFSPLTYFQLYKFLRRKKILIHYCISNSFKNFFINFILNITSCKLFMISDLGYNPENYNYYKRNFIKKIKIFFLFRFRYYLIRILIILNLVPKINFFFEASSFVIKSIKNSFSYKFDKIFPFFKISYYKKVIKINSKHYKKINPKNITEDYIVFIDGALMDHKDVTLREGEFSEKIKKNYFNNINRILKVMSKIFKKKIIICLHPKNEHSIKRNDFSNLECVKYKTEYYINKAFIVVFHESSSITQAISLKKKIISLTGINLGNYINKRCQLYIDDLNLVNFNIEEFDLQEGGGLELLEKLEHSLKYYDNYIKDNIAFDETVLGIDQVILYLKNLKLK